MYINLLIRDDGLYLGYNVNKKQISDKMQCVDFNDAETIEKAETERDPETGQSLYHWDGERLVKCD